MLTEDDIRRLLLQKTETKNLDYKGDCNWATASNDEKCELVKDILAMSNTQDGGQIVFGVADRTFDFVGMDAQSFASFDPTRVNDFVRRFSDPPFACTVYRFTIDGRRTVVIEVPEFSEVPIICKADANSANSPRNTILRKGGLYVRTDKPSSELVSSAEEMRDIVGRASRKKRDELLRTIRDLIEGNPVPPKGARQAEYDAELRDAETFFATNLPSDFNGQGHWEVVVRPTAYVENRIPDHPTVAELIRSSTVSLRGWSFPHTNSANASNFARGRQSHTSFMHHTEGYRAYFSGLFCWKSAFWENERVPDLRILSFIGAIYEITEFFQFFKRYYTRVSDVDGLHIEIKLVDTRDRVLVSLDPAVVLFGEYASRESEICLTRDVTLAELETDSEAIARRLAMRVFALFNWNDMKEDRIKYWQDKLLTRAF